MRDMLQSSVGEVVHPWLFSCLSPFAPEGVVKIWGADPVQYSAALPHLKIERWEPGQSSDGGLLLCPDPFRVVDFLSDTVVTDALAADRVVAAWSFVPSPQPQPAAPYTACYRHRTVAGALLRSSQFDRAQVTVLHESTTRVGPEFHLLLWSRSPLSNLRPGLYEHGALSTMAPVALGRSTRSDRDSRAIALVNRLLAVEDRTLALRGEILRLKEQLNDQGGSRQRDSFDFPRVKVPWPLADGAQGKREPSLYDYRSDDAVLVEARRGEVFMATHSLLSDIPDFAGAVAALNAAEPALKLSEYSPDASIVIPVYGQLAYTVNALDSLLNHKSRFSVEIIIVDDCSPDGVTAEFVSQIQGVRYHRQPQNGGFIESCNTGGMLARGQYIIMLNSDTRVVSGWLDELIGSFSIFPKAGLIGSKLLYPDGTLQEAGGIIWRDGSAWNYGREDDPNRPQYCFARQVDYVSGASIAVPAELWKTLGGFDRYYTPAYAEDADLCQRIRSLGLEVWFQSTSRVVHYEGKTSGTSTSGSIKAYQLVNLRKLFLRWRSDFELHRRSADSPFFEKERSVRKRILFVDAVTPTPDQDAGSVQTVLGLRCARAAGFKAHFVPEDNWLFDQVYTPRMQREGVECTYAPFDVGFEAYIRRYGWLFDTVIVYRVSIIRKCLGLLQEHAPGALLLFHLADLHFLRLKRQAELDGDADMLRASEVLKEQEFDAIRQSHCTITHSTVEAGILAEEVPDAPVTIWPLMMEVVGTRVGFQPRRNICFLGGYRHPPNVDAVFFFVREVLPLIHAVRPEIQFIVAGANPTAEILELADSKIVVTGMVDELADVFDTVRVFVCPLRVGAGAKGKVMSALAHGLPIVSTSIGIEGAGLLPDEHVLVADSPAEFAAAVLRLYDDAALWESLSVSAQRLIEEKFSLSMGVEKLEEAIEKGHRRRLDLDAL